MTHNPAITARTGATVHANGIDIHYVERGTGEPLVLLHGGMVSTGPVWDGTPVSYGGHLDRFAEHFRVIAPDTRGCGATAHTDGTISYALLVDDVLALIDALGLDRPMIAGFSDGATTATILGIRRPDAVRAIVNDAGFDVLDPNSPSFSMLRMLLGGSTDAEHADPDAAATFMQHAGMGTVFELLQADCDDARGEGYWRTYLDLVFPRTTRSPGYTFADLRAVTAPTLVLVGDRDICCSVEDAVTTFRTLPDAELAILANHDHSIGAAAVEATIDFLRRHGEG